MSMRSSSDSVPGLSDELVLECELTDRQRSSLAGGIFRGVFVPSRRTGGLTVTSCMRSVVSAIEGVSLFHACVFLDSSDTLDLRASELSSSDSLNLVLFAAASTSAAGLLSSGCGTLSSFFPLCSGVKSKRLPVAFFSKP